MRVERDHVTGSEGFATDFVVVRSTLEGNALTVAHPRSAVCADADVVTLNKVVVGVLPEPNTKTIAAGGVPCDDVPVSSSRSSDRIAITLNRHAVSVPVGGDQPTDIRSEVVANDRVATALVVNLDGVITKPVDGEAADCGATGLNREPVRIAVRDEASVQFDDRRTREPGLGPGVNRHLSRDGR